jgi:hypothetical protein
MRLRTAIIVVHFATLLVAYGLFESVSNFPSIAGIDTRAIIFVKSLLAAISGATLVAWKSGAKDRITFTFSTILSLFLLAWTILHP